MSSTSSNQNGAAPLRLLAETAALFREETFALDHLVQDLYRDIEMLSNELTRKGDELEQARCKLREQQQQGSNHTKESTASSSFSSIKRSDWPRHLARSNRSASRPRKARAGEQREASRMTFLEQQVRTTESERPASPRAECAASHRGNQRRHGYGASSESLAPLMAELGDMQPPACRDPNQLAEARTQLPRPSSGPPRPWQKRRHRLSSTGQRPTADGANLGHLAASRRERVELESELELVRTRATELQEVVNQQRRELVEQRADITTDSGSSASSSSRARTKTIRTRRRGPLVAASRASRSALRPDPVVSSVMAQFARLQKDVAQRRKKK